MRLLLRLKARRVVADQCCEQVRSEGDGQQLGVGSHAMLRMVVRKKDMVAI